MKLNLGCGSQVPDGWVNVDSAIGARLAKIPFFNAVNKRLGLLRLDWDRRIRLVDLRKPLPWEDDSIDVIYSSHLLEHLSRMDGRRLLGECYRVLRVGGVIRLVVPDLRHLVDEYLEGWIPADELLQALGVQFERPEGTFKQRVAPLFRYPHRCTYDGPRLLEVLREAGFLPSTREAFDSDIDDIRAVELESRTRDAAIVEGRKASPSDPAVLPLVLRAARQKPSK